MTLQQDAFVSAHQRPIYGGVDIGGTSIKIGLVDNFGAPLANTNIPTRPDVRPDSVVREIRSAIHELIALSHLQEADLAAVGLGAPGPVDTTKGRFRNPFNLPGWHNFPIRDRLREAIGKPVTFANDANAAAFGEYWVGSGQEYNSIVFFTLGTGIGGGIIVDGSLIDGENSLASECGHLIIDCQDDARICSCGLPGHLEAYASAKAVVQRAKDALQRGADSSVNSRLESGDTLTTVTLFEEAEKGDAFSLDIILQTAYYLSIGIVNVLHVIDPSAVLLGGAMNFGGRDSTIGQRFLIRIREEISRRTFPLIAQNVVVDFSKLGGDAGYIGAAGIARKKHLDSEQ